MTTDTIADMLTRIRNANLAKHQIVQIPSTKVTRNIAQVLFAEGLIDSFEELKNGLKSFKGVQRRFSFLFKYRDSIFIDDYAHHPTEISEVLSGVKDVYKNKKIICVFQPHRISRVKNLRKEFSKSFKITFVSAKLGALL